MILDNYSHGINCVCVGTNVTELSFHNRLTAIDAYFLQLVMSLSAMSWGLRFSTCRKGGTRGGGLVASMVVVTTLWTFLDWLD